MAITVSLDMERNILITYTSVTLTRKMKIKGSLLQEVKVLDKTILSSPLAMVISSAETDTENCNQITQ